MKVLVVCASGVGTSMIMKTKVNKILDGLKLEEKEVKSCGLEEAKGILKKYDLVICSEKLAKELQEAKKLVSVVNLLDDEELEDKIKKSI